MDANSERGLVSCFLSENYQNLLPTPQFESFLSTFAPSPFIISLFFSVNHNDQEASYVPLLNHRIIRATNLNVPIIVASPELFAPPQGFHGQQLQDARSSL